MLAGYILVSQSTSHTCGLLTSITTQAASMHSVKRSLITAFSPARRTYGPIFRLQLKSQGFFAEAANLHNPDHRQQACSVSLKTFGSKWLRHLPATPLLVFSTSPRPPFYIT